MAENKDSTKQDSATRKFCQAKVRFEKDLEKISKKHGVMLAAERDIGDVALRPYEKGVACLLVSWPARPTFLYE